ncbi:MAG: hypothetical protein R3Y29_08625 [bacterium]
MEKKSKLLLLLKHDLKNLLISMKPFYVVGIVFTIMTIAYNTYINFIDPQVIKIYEDKDISLVFSIVISSILTCTPIFIIKEYHKTVFGKQAYLTHTLPVCGNEILLSKVISSIMILGINFYVTTVLAYLGINSFYGVDTIRVGGTMSIDLVFFTISAVCYMVVGFYAIGLAHNSKNAKKHNDRAMLIFLFLILILNTILYILYYIILLEIFWFSYNTRMIGSIIATILFGIYAYVSTKKIIDNKLNLS